MLEIKEVSGIFNDFFAILYGSNKKGLLELMQEYKENQLFYALLHQLDEAAALPVKEVMLEAYGIYKKYSGRNINGDGWLKIFEEVRAFDKKWHNPWSRQIIIALVAALEPMEKPKESTQCETGKVEAA